MLKIGQVAEIIDYSVETIRHYETIGLIKSSARSKSGQRLFNKNDVEILRFIKEFRKIGVSLKDISVAIKDFNDDGFCLRIEEIYEKYSLIIEQKSAELENCKKMLQALKGSCQNCRYSQTPGGLKCKAKDMTYAKGINTPEIAPKEICKSIKI